MTGNKNSGLFYGGVTEKSNLDVGTFIGDNWTNHMSKVVKSYSLYTCKYFYAGSVGNISTEKLSFYIDNRLRLIEDGHGEIVRTGLVGYNLIHTEIVEAPKSQLRFEDFQTNLEEQAILVYESERNKYSRVGRVGGCGCTLQEMEERARHYLQSTKYMTDYYIVTPNKVYLCTGVRKFQKSTVRMSNENLLILPCWLFAYYGKLCLP